MNIHSMDDPTTRFPMACACDGGANPTQITRTKAATLAEDLVIAAASLNFFNAQVEIREYVDCIVGDKNGLGIGGDVHNKNVADPSPGARAGG
jgi:hypothetical protein